MKTPSAFVKFHVPEIQVSDFWSYVHESLLAGKFTECEPTQEKSTGFTLWEDPFDADFDKHVYHVGEYIMFNFRQDQRKISKVLLKKYIKDEITKYHETNGYYPKKDARQNIRENIYNWLMAKTLPQPASYAVIWNPGKNWLILGATNSSIMDAFLEKFEEAFRVFPVPLFHVNLAVHELNLAEQQKTLLTTLVPPQSPTALEEGKFIGFEFLTWLWYTIETNTTKFMISPTTCLEVFLGDRMLLCLTDDEKEQVSCMTQANALIEAHAALKQGKMVKNIQLMLQTKGKTGDNEYLLSLDNSLLSVKGLKIPKIQTEYDEDDQDGPFLERMFFLEEVIQSVNTMYETFCRTRLDSTWNSEELPKMHEWIDEQV